MKKIILILSLCVFYIYAEENCEQYFEARKSQMQDQIREYDEARQSLEAFKASFEALQKEKMQALIQKEMDINASLQEIKITKEQNERILEATKQNLQTINDKTMGRIAEIYAKMKDAAVAGILSEMDDDEASKILLSLEPRKISSIMAKMQPKKASDLTLLLKNLDQNITLK
ncbi:MotE family protein [Campylobacter insulaenigrae]|uniref:MotE family protein n=1 Tax=Campylobacter insulaenigrae TaxID=260714 RepID=UPI000F70D6B9|nr:MotE family protein [Campylobacter insulaenigrae]MCR6570463.1 MotE family protein [Campylobacter insulaenigrae]MCR6572119.1 MotE family protein [Campylobacter insulaenigrae]MCR6573689.1 MotE family protein [Campylobacter insulaenigrae]MCR6575502.1 MotE family protein [Campylobacter insulaenigrae]MCR6579787.1 MotE family protein [Campylobacter insulaenigrae]